MLTRVGVPVEYEAEPSAPEPEPVTLICFSHLRWNFVFQRPQHLMSRFARDMDVIYWEEPIEIGPGKPLISRSARPRMRPTSASPSPILPQGMPEDAREAALKRLLDAHVARIRGPIVAWYYTPMMLPFSRHLTPDATVYDAMDELSKFKFAPEHLLDLEQELIDRADIVLTGGSSLFEAKKDRHANVHCFPSSVDRAHFMRGPRAPVRPGRPGGFAAPAPRLLRSDRRAFRHGAARPNRREAPRLVVRHAGPGREDFRGRAAEAAQHPLSRPQDLCPAARLSVGLGRRA